MAVSQADRLHQVAQERLQLTVGATIEQLLLQVTLERSRAVRDGFAASTARWVAGGQLAAANFAAEYVRAILPPVEPVDLAAALADRLLTSQDPKAFVGLLRFWHLQDEGADVAEARQMAGTYARGLAEGDVQAAARAGMDAAAQATRRVTRYRKIAGLSACDWCQTIAGGDQPTRYLHPDRVPRHDFCRCSYGPEFVEEYLTRKGWRLAPLAGAPPPTPTGFTATGDWAKDRKAIEALNTSGWFKDKYVYTPERLDQLKAIGKAIDDEARRRLGPRPFGMAPWDWERQLGEKRRAVLGELRDMGRGRLRLTGTDAMKDEIRRAVGYYPTDWFKVMGGRPGSAADRPWKVKTTDRGYFSQSRREIVLDGSGNRRRNVAIHEIGHGMQLNNAVGNAEYQFHQQRTTDPNGTRQPLVSLRDPDDPNAVTRPDKYKRDYTGREYSWGTLEVLTTTAESVFGTSEYADQDMTNWLLGTMAKL